MSGDARVYGDAQVSGDAQVYGDARVYGNAQVSPINIIGLAYNVTITDAHMMIGCEFHTFEDWRSFDERRIAQMEGLRAAKFWKEHGPYLLSLCASRKSVEA